MAGHLLIILRHFEISPELLTGAVLGYTQWSERGSKLEKIARVLGFDRRCDMISKQEYEERVAENQGICLICGLVHYDVPRLRKSKCHDCGQMEVLHIGNHPTYAVHRWT